MSRIRFPCSQTENSGPPRRPWVNSNRRRRRRPVNGLHHRREGGPPNTAFIPSHLMRRSHVGFSFLRRSISVSSLQMEWICVPNITAVKVRKRMASRQRKISSSTDTPGEKSLHSFHWTLIQVKKCIPLRPRAWAEIKAMYIVKSTKNL